MDQVNYLKPSQQNRQKRRDKRLYEELIECRRWGGGDKNKKYRDKGDKRRIQNLIEIDSLPQKTSYKAKRCWTSLEDNLEPLIRFLESNKGRLWNDVYSDLIKQLDTRTATGLHVLQHLWDFVAINTKLEDDKLIHYNSSGGFSWFRSFRFYVDPKTGKLCSKQNSLQKGPYPKKARWKKAKEKAKLKRKLGIISKTEEVFPFPQIMTYQQELKVKGIYDFKEDEKKTRIKLIRITMEEDLKIIAEVLKSNFYNRGEILNIDLNNQIDSYYRKTIEQNNNNWKLFDAGTFEFKRLKYRWSFGYSWGINERLDIP